MPPISSLHNPRVKNAVRLRSRRHREKQGRILIDGARELRRAIEGGATLIEAFVCRSLCSGDEARSLLDALPKTACEMLEVSEAVFDKLAFGDRVEGVLAVAETPRMSLASIKPRPAVAHLSESPLLAVVEGVEKPGNLGAAIRSADAAGVSALIVADARTDLYNPNAIRASLGTIFTLPVREATSGETLEWLREHGFRMYAARVDGAAAYTDADYRGPTAIVLGSEAAGLSPLWSGDDIQTVRLPMLGAADSLNLSVTAAVLFYEALRQRNHGGIKRTG